MTTPFVSREMELDGLVCNTLMLKRQGGPGPKERIDDMEWCGKPAAMIYARQPGWFRDSDDMRCKEHLGNQLREGATGYTREEFPARCKNRSTNFFEDRGRKSTYQFCEEHRPDSDWIGLVKVTEISEREFLVLRVLGS